jgi:hypothetical protein
VCRKCKERIPFSKGKRKLYCDECKTNFQILIIWKNRPHNPKVKQ